MADAAASPVNYIVLEDVRATPEFRAPRIVPTEVTSLRRRWPSVLFATMHKRQNDMEGLRRGAANVRKTHTPMAGSVVNSVPAPWIA